MTDFSEIFNERERWVFRYKHLDNVEIYNETSVKIHVDLHCLITHYVTIIKVIGVTINIVI